MGDFELRVEAGAGFLRTQGRDLIHLGEIALTRGLARLSIDASRKRFGDSKAAELGSALECNLSLRKVVLLAGGIGHAGASTLALGLQRNHGIETFCLPANRIGDVGALFMASAMESHPSLTRLNLADNDIGDPGAEYLASGLANGVTPLQVLQLEKNKIGDRGARALAEALLSNTTLRALGLESNSIGDQGARELASALLSNTTLLGLGLAKNHILSYFPFALVMPHNETLRTLKLGDRLPWRNNTDLDACEGQLLRNQRLAQNRASALSLCLSLLKKKDK